MKCSNPNCTADPLHIFGTHPGDLCSACYDFEGDRNRDLTGIRDRVMAKKFYEKNREAMAKTSKLRARRLSKRRAEARAHTRKIKREREQESEKCMHENK